MVWAYHAARLLGIENGSENGFTALRLGARTRSILATNADTSHRYMNDWPQVMVKFYKGANNTDGAKQYQHYHKYWFHEIPVMIGSPYVQQSIDAGFIDDLGSYAIVQYIKGVELAPKLELANLSKTEAEQIIRDILLNILLPLWSTGLRFKDCHPGNLVYTPDGKTVLIDTEQMRKDADEYLHTPEQWDQRNKHEKVQLSRLPKLVQRIILATNTGIAKNQVLRIVNSALESTRLNFNLAKLGRDEAGANASVESAVQEFLLHLIDEGLIA